MKIWSVTKYVWLVSLLKEEGFDVLKEQEGQGESGFISHPQNIWPGFVKMLRMMNEL